MWRNLLIKAQIVTRHGGSKKRIDKMTLDERPLVGSEIAGRYKIIAISEPVPIGTNLSAGEPEMGIEICVEDL